MVESLRDRIKRHEGLRLTPYRDSRGLLTVGYGHRLPEPDRTDASVVVLTEALADTILDADLAAAWRVVPIVACWPPVNDARCGVVVEMTFQLGGAGVRRFTRMLRALEQERWDVAAAEMLDSRWAQQTPERAQELARIMRTGEAS